MIQNSAKAVITSFKYQAACPTNITHSFKFFFCSSDKIIKWKTFQNPRMKKMQDNLANRFNKDDEKYQEKKERREKEFKLLKEYESYSKQKEDQLSEVPANLVIKNLYYPPCNANVILLGVEKRNPMHASFVHGITNASLFFQLFIYPQPKLAFKFTILSYFLMMVHFFIIYQYFKILKGMNVHKLLLLLLLFQDLFIIISNLLMYFMPIDCMANLKPDMVTTQIAPDMPYFIRTKIQFQDAWNRFVKGKFDYKFYVNPEPTSLYDIMLNNESINQLVSGGILNSQDVFEIGSLFIYTKNHVSKEFEVDTYLTPLIFLYNNPHLNCNLVVNDYPYIKYRDNINKHISLSELKDIFNQFKQVIEEQGTKTMFDPLLLKPELFIYPKVAYMTESIRNSCYTSKKVLAIVDRHMTDEIETYWKTLSKQPQNLNLFLKDEFFKNSVDKQMKENEKKQTAQGQNPVMTEEGVENITPEKRDTFLEYVEKHVLLDLMLDPIIRDYFIKNRVFPFPGKKYSGHKTMIQQIFVMLDHFYFQHNKTTREQETQSYEERIAHGTPNETK